MRPCVYYWEGPSIHHSPFWDDFGDRVVFKYGSLLGRRHFERTGVCIPTLWGKNIHSHDGWSCWANVGLILFEWESWLLLQHPTPSSYARQIVFFFPHMCGRVEVLEVWCYFGRYYAFSSRLLFLPLCIKLVRLSCPVYELGKPPKDLDSHTVGATFVTEWMSCV